MFKSYTHIAIAVAAAVALGGVYAKGRHDGQVAAQADAREQLVDQLTERNKINENVSRMSAADLCRELGGVYNNGECK